MANLYLLSYNVAAFFGWAACLAITLKVWALDNGSTQDVYKAVWTPLAISQTAAVLEVAHSMVGLVRSPVMITAMQVASRLWLVWGIIHADPQATSSGALGLKQLGGPAAVGGLPLELNLVTLIVAWSLSEIIRYSFYAFKELGGTPYIITWLRYTAFIVLYPLGVASELSMVWLALPAIKATHMWSLDMPNRINFGFDYYLACIAIAVFYAPGLPMLYSYMLTQRKKVLGGSSKAKQQ